MKILFNSKVFVCNVNNTFAPSSTFHSIFSIVVVVVVVLRDAMWNKCSVNNIVRGRKEDGKNIEEKGGTSGACKFLRKEVRQKKNGGTPSLSFSLHTFRS